MLLACALLFAAPAAADVLLGSRASLPVDGAPISLAAVDVDLDGVLDLVTANEAGGDGPSLSVLPGFGNGSFRGEERLNLSPTRYLVQRVLGGDFDANGDGDLAVAVDDISTFPPQAQILIYLSDGAGQFRRPLPFPVGGMFPRCLGAGDVDADGDVDLVVCVAADDSGAGQLMVLAGDGTGAFVAEPARPAGPAPRTLEVADVDADGVVDAIVADAEEGVLRIYYGNAGSGLATEPQQIEVDTQIAAARVVGDADAGLPQLIAVSAVDSQVLRFVQAPARTFTAAVTYAVDDPPSDAAVVDLDLDGVDELVLLSGGNNRLSVYALDADSLTRRQRLTIDELATSLVVADVDGDGRPDVAVPAAGTDSANLFLNGRSPAGTPTATSPVPTATATPELAATPSATRTATQDLAPPTPTVTAGFVWPTATATPTATLALPTATATATPLPMAGDANCDGLVNSYDVSALVLQMFDSWCGGADVNGDGMMSAADIVLLMEILEETP